MIFGLVGIFSHGVNLNTDLMSLLPHDHQSKTIQTITDRFSSRLSRQVVFLIGNQNKKESQQSAIAFVSQLEQTTLFQTINLTVNKNEQIAWEKLYFPYRLSLLTQTAHDALVHNDIKSIKTTAIETLYNPMGIASTSLLKNDPYFLFEHLLFSLPKPATNITIENGLMMAQRDNTWFAIINATLNADAFSLSNQNKVIQIIKEAKKNILERYPRSSFLMSGMIFYAKSGADEAQHNITTIGIGSLLGIILIVFFTFRSFQPIILTLISGISGFISAFVVTYLFFGSIYLFTLIFGMSLIGIAVDYAFFYYADQLLGGKNWRAELGLKHIFSGVTIALINVILAYLIISVTPFPGLRQLALFSIIGLLMAYFTVIAFFPALIAPTGRKSEPMILHFTKRYLHFCRTLSRKKMSLLFSMLLLFAAAGIYQLHTNDDIHLLESIPPALMQNEANIQKIIGNHFSMDYILITGNNPEETLTHAHQITRLLDMTFPKTSNRYLSISSYLPTVAQQKDNFRLVKTKLINQNLITYLEKLGMLKQPAERIEQQLAKIDFKPLTMKRWQNSSASKTLSFLWLGKINQQYATIILLSNRLNPSKVQTITANKSFAVYINKANQLSQTFKLYRKRISLLLLFAFFGIFLLLSLRYGLKNSWKYFLPPAVACTFSLALLGWFQIPLTLFNMLALILVTSLAIDDVLFFAETKASYDSTMLAVTLSAIVSSLSFGLLMFSHTPVIHSFGLTTFIGILSSFLVSPFASRQARID